MLKSDGTTQNYLYLQRDYQGSIVAISDATGQVLEKRLFDAWGNVLVQDGAGNTLSGLTLLDRGYTGHEHLQSVGLIHMNGRLYDLKLHRFIQPDNNIQDPFNTQNFNRYGYVLNNPLKYNDPSGELFWEIFAGALFSSYASGVQSSGGQLNPGKWNSTAWTNAALGGVSFGASIIATNYTNNYLDNYNKPPELNTNSINGGNVGKNTHPYVATADIHLPTQHNSFGFNWTYLSEGASGQRAIYEIANTINTPIQWIMGRSVGDGSMRNLDGTAMTTDQGVMGFANTAMTLVGVAQMRATISELYAAKEGSQGGLNLFKWGAEQTGKSIEWKAGDYMLHLPNKGTPALNWKANYGALRSEMNLGKPIFDSYRLPNGNLIPTGGFLNAERFTLQSRGWIYNPRQGAWLPQ